ncbi:hypothetical protein [Streptomyces sp. V3I7]|uniref:hypothetical protein n=1 Tax=Streptomyces sp. V3I7 TaxID=3042278 RepID=UPI002782C8AC|nr:hypothetical protein [Streptomyces sp. V3I7]MDQ0991683.1 hypothetical protein [Streptomyces sp. V3I7]
MIKRVSHMLVDNHPADFDLALEVAHEINAPKPPPRVLEVSAPQLMGLRIRAERPRRHKVPLRRLTAVSC